MVEDLFPSIISFSAGTICCIIFFLVDIYASKMPLPNDQVKSAPWYSWIGGVLGAYDVIVNILTVPKFGTVTVQR
ncbi:hypothetical protein G6F37_007718 [Rhizopus arrhizus]|nr:hypothetical protein G6F38_008301 [Rhizopus arrhizus]KAG1156327.1 hypothetical protein G6F37_007718 [Rhizopus arrhizus]